MGFWIARAGMKKAGFARCGRVAGVMSSFPILLPHLLKA
jgi:hypothetical protein